MKSVVSGDVDVGSVPGNYYIYLGTWVNIGNSTPDFTVIDTAD